MTPFFAVIASTVKQSRDSRRGADRWISNLPTSSGCCATVVERLLADHYGFDKRRGYLAEPEGWSRALWAHYAELGLLGLPFAEEYGGFGGGPIEIMLVMEAFGRVFALEPYLATVVLGGTALRLAGSAAQKSAILPQIAEGSMTLAFAHGERQARYDLTRCADDRQAQARAAGCSTAPRASSCTATAPIG